MARMVREIPEGSHAVPAEAQAAYDRKRKEIARRILEKAAEDAGFREQLVENPREALTSAGFAEALDELHGHGDSAEVAGHAFSHYWQDCWNYSYDHEYWHQA